MVDEGGETGKRALDAPAVEREADYRRASIEQLLEGTKHPDELGATAFDAVREQWIAPQCAVLEFLLDRLRARRGLAAKDLEPFLEIGAFTAHLSGYLATTHRLRGYCGDLDREVIERSFREVFPRLGLRAETLTAVRADASSLDFDDDSLGFVFCFSALHHFEEPAACLREIRRVLRPGGVFLCAREPIQPQWRRSRKPTDCPELEAGLIENVYRVAEYEAMIRAVFDDVISMPYDDLRMPAAVPVSLQPLVARTVNGSGRRWLRRFICTHFGGQDYSALAFKQTPDRGT